MKKLLAFLAAAAVCSMLFACNGGEGKGTTGSTAAPIGTTPTAETTAPSETTAGDAPSIPAEATALDILNRIWEDYPEEERFFAAGGDYSEAHAKDGAPGIFAVEGDVGESMDSRLGFPNDARDLLLDAASLQFMMNANTFTSGAYHVKSGTDLGSLAREIRDNIQARQWVCGFPDKLLVISFGDFMISAFGHEDFTEPFKSHILASCAGANILFEEAIVFGD